MRAQLTIVGLLGLAGTIGTMWLAFSGRITLALICGVLAAMPAGACLELAWGRRR
jgi:hypothetical protein